MFNPFDFNTRYKCSQISFRVALLDDVYKQIRAKKEPTTHIDEAHKEPPFRRIDATLTDGDSDDEVGIASGYAVQHPIPSPFVPPQNHANEIDFDHSQRYTVAGNKAGLTFVESVTNTQSSQFFLFT